MNYKINLSLFDIITNSKLYKLKKGLDNYQALYFRFIVSKYKNDSNYNITSSDFIQVFNIISMNLYKDYIDTKFKNLLDLDIDLLIRSRIYRVSYAFIESNTFYGTISRDFITLIEDLNIKENCIFDNINMKINEIDYSCPYP